MKKNIIILIAISIVFALGTVLIVVHQRHSNDLFYQNVEALSDDEGNQNYSECYNSFSASTENYALVCGICQYLPVKGNNIGGICYF